MNAKQRRHKGRQADELVNLRQARDEAVEAMERMTAERATERAEFLKLEAVAQEVEDLRKAVGTTERALEAMTGDRDAQREGRQRLERDFSTNVAQARSDVAAEVIALRGERDKAKEQVAGARRERDLAVKEHNRLRGKRDDVATQLRGEVHRLKRDLSDAQL